MSESGLHVERAGEGPGVVLAHGFGGSARNFRPQVRALQGAFCVVTYDARGHARSEAPGDPEAYTEAAQVADFAEAAAAAGPGPVVAGGLSMGAATACAFARRHPERVRGLVLASPPPGPRAGQGVAGRAEAFAEALEQEGLEGAGARFVWGPDSGLDEAGARLVRQGFLEHDPQALAHTLRRSLARLAEVGERAEALAGLGLPVLVVAGEGDPVSLAAARELAAGVPGSHLEIVPGAGHVVNLAAPRAFNDALRSFLEELPPPE